MGRKHIPVIIKIGNSQGIREAFFSFVRFGLFSTGACVRIVFAVFVFFLLIKSDFNFDRQN